MGDSSLSDVERPKLGNDIYKHPLRTQMVAMDPESGLPRVVSAVSMEDSKAPPLEPETFVCMGDESAFVIRDLWGDVVLSVGPDRVRWFQGDGFGHPPGWLASLTVGERDRVNAITVMGGDKFWCRVEPLRPQCQHYCRVMTDFEGSDENKRVERVCTAQRTEGGEYVALGDTRVYACEHRTPRDFVSEQRLRQFDAAIVARGQKTVKYWDGEAALEAALRAAEEEEQNG